MHNLLNHKADGDKVETTPGAISVSLDQETEGTISIDSPKSDNRRLVKGCLI